MSAATSVILVARFDHPRFGIEEYPMRSASSRLGRNNLADRAARHSGKKLDGVVTRVALLKDVFDIFWRVASLGLVLAGAILFVYLKRIGWSDLFIESAVSVSGLTYLLLAAVVLALTTLAVFAFPSVLVVVINFGRVRTPSLRRTLLPIYAAALLGWCIAIVGMVTMGYRTVVTLGLPFVFAAGAAVWQGLRTDTEMGQGFQKWWHLGKRAAEAGVVMVVNSVGIALFVELAPPPHSASNWLVAGYICAFLFLSFLALVPGVAYLAARARHAGHAVPIKAALIGVFLLTWCTFYCISYLLPVSLKLLQASAIYSDEAAHFQIVEDKLVPALKRGGLSVTAVDASSFVSGYVRYGFGNIRLLCRDPLEKSPTPISLLPRNQAVVTSEMREAGLHCVKTNLSELRKYTAEALPQAKADGVYSPPPAAGK